MLMSIASECIRKSHCEEEIVQCYPIKNYHADGIEKVATRDPLVETV